MDQQLVLTLHNWAASQPAIAALVVLVAERGVFLLPLVLGALWLWPGPSACERRVVLLAAALGFALALGLVMVLGPLVYRPRPFLALATSPLFTHAADSSFPSDHTLLGFALVGPLLWRQPRLGCWLGLWVLVVGFARVAAAVHYPSDILGSAALAAAPAAAGLWLSPLLVARLRFVQWLVQFGMFDAPGPSRA